MTGGCPRTRKLFASLEAVPVIALEPIPAAQLAEAVSAEEVLVLETLEDLTAPYRGEDGGRGHGFGLRQSVGGWRIYSARPRTNLVDRFIVGSATSRLSQAALETLVIVAYRQPVSRSRILHIRGVNVGAAVCTLAVRGLTEEVGESVSGARLCGTTREFLGKMGFASLDELTPLAPYLSTSEELDELEELL